MQKWIISNNLGDKVISQILHIIVLRLHAIIIQLVAVVLLHRITLLAQRYKINVRCICVIGTCRGSMGFIYNHALYRSYMVVTLHRTMV
jgi:hypothetical protein